ncbi:opioid growth factor receptor-like [Morone saxatilis]|uniref:opioid growth factor receptor-like n=1 Tax=Morone saxatilis TaxID=34816 RepID=UPI0015E1E442|nr:opioid growth factor receptor-like [Morone saxatilis]
MKVVSVLCRFIQFVMGFLALLSPVLERLWRIAGIIWRFTVKRVCLIARAVSRAIGWPKETETRGPFEPGPVEISDDEDELPAKCSPKSWIEGSDFEGQREAAVGERAAASNRELPVSGECEDEEEFDNEQYRVNNTDELYCDYDSTWETEETEEVRQRTRSRRSARSRYYKFSKFETAAIDMQNYRHDYPSQNMQYGWKMQRSDDKPNLNFYLGEKPSEPDGIYIDAFHNEWSKDYASLEYVHTYIQWLFPLQEPGVNYEATPLTKEEIKGFLQSPTAQENLLKSYKLMLGFYGIELCNEVTGEVRRAPNWKERYNNLNNHTHNSLRITRILKCHGNLGFPHYQAPLVRFFLEETLVHGLLPNIKDSVLNYFLFAVLDKKQRRHLIKFAYLNYDRKDEFVWCPRKIQTIWSRLSQESRF